MIIKLLLTFAFSFILTVAVGAVLVPTLRRIKAGQSIKKIGPSWHMSKQGTPTMGGIMFIIGMGVSSFVMGIPAMKGGDYRHIFVFVFGLVFAAIGFVDDFQKLRKKQNTGLTAMQKLVLQIAAAIAFVFLLRSYGYLSPNLYIPFFEITIPLNEVVYFAFAAFVIVGCVNAVNLTDGVDGLASGVSIPVALFYVVISAKWGYESLGIFGAGMTGALMGFLVYNFHPAKVFMGDTGSLYLGGIVCAMAFAMDMPLVLVTLGFVYIIETLSDIIQVLYFKISHGKRIFKMAPIHHHFEMCGWSEEKVFAVFSLVSAVFAVISYLAVYGRYGL